MTDTTSFFNNIVSQVRAFTDACDQIRLIADRIGSDSSLSAGLADAASLAGRQDLKVADFDNLKAAIDAVSALMNSNVPSVNAATVKLPFYMVL
jgi:hypothetical protein